MNLDGVCMSVSATDRQGVVSAETVLRFVQRGSRVLARYGGGSVRRGYLVGRLFGSTLTFRYVQTEASGDVHGGHSVCDVTRGPEGRIGLVEHFTWDTRDGSGTNVFEEIQSWRQQ
jgi:hypothetical protein